MIAIMGIMYRVYGLRLGPNFVLRLGADKSFSLRLTIEKVHTFAIFNDKYLQPYDCSDISFTATVKCTNPKTEIKVKPLKYKSLEYKLTL